MQIIPIQALPTQRFSIPLDGNEWGITIRATNGTISMSFTLNGDVVIQNTRAVAGRRIIPATYQEAGNSTLITQSFELPDYTKFGTTQQLVYISAADLEIVRTKTPGIVTAADFDPNGALPMRFKPSGYTEGYQQYITETAANNYVTEDGDGVYLSEDT